jgi:hypothetical protein
MRAALSRAAAVAAGVVLLAGCGVPTSIKAQVPTSGPIEQGKQVGVQQEDQFIRVIAREPRPGMSPTEVVQGFLDASASFDGNHAVARMYLTPEASKGWNTNAGVTIYNGAPEFLELGSNVTVSAAQSGAIEPNGRFVVTGPSSSVAETFGLTQQGGEWRIRQVPEGLLLSQSDVDRAFRSFSEYFFNPSYKTLVPDPRMVPVIGSGLATTLVRQLVAGPSEWLQPAVRTGFPAGVGLNIDSVPIEAGVARVDLTINARSADDRTRTAMSQQIVWTLKQLPEVQAVEITAAGQPLIVPGVGSPQPRDAWPQVDPSAMPADAAGYAARPEGVVRLGADAVVPVAGSAGGGERVFVDIAVSDDGQWLSGIDTDGAVWTGRMQEGAGLIEVREPGAHTSIAYDGQSAWVVDADAGLLSIESNGTAEAVTVSGLGRRGQLIAAAPSRDGTRAALIVRRGPRTMLLLARIVRTAGSSSRITVDAPVRVESTLAEVVDVAWSSADTLSALGTENAGTLQIYDVSLARGTAVARGGPDAPVTVGAAPGLPTLVGSANGLVYEFTAGEWSERVRGSAPTYPG